MKYKYKWVYSPVIDKLKEQIIPLKRDKFLFKDMPVIKNGKFKGCVGTMDLVLCMVSKKNNRKENHGYK